MKKQKVKKIFFIVLALIAVSAICTKELTNSDIWLWLRTGDLVVTGRTFLYQDFLSHTAWGRPWIVHGWGFGVLVFIAYTLGKELGLVLLRLGISIGTFFALKKRGTLLNSKISHFAVTVTAGFLAISNAWMLRPHILGGLFLALLLLLIELYRKEEPRYILLTPILTLFWANTHASLPFLLILLVALLGCEISETTLSAQIKDPVQKIVNNRRLKLLIITVPLNIVTSFINPYFLNLYRYFFKIGPTVQQNILEWLPLANFFNGNFTLYFLIFMGTSVLALLLVAATTPKEIKHWEIFLTLISIYLAFSALRHMVIAVLIMVPLTSKNLTVLTKELKGTKRSLLELLFLSIIVILAWNPVKNAVRGNWGIRRDIISPQAIQFLKSNPPQGKMYNHFNFGSSLLWNLYPQHKTFIDGRVDMFVPDIYEEWLTPATNQEGWRKIFQKYEISWVIFPTYDVWPDLKEEIRKNNWCVVFWDDTASIILKKEKNPELCSNLAYDYGHPFLETPSPDKYKEITEDYLRAINASSYNTSAHNKLGKLYAHRGNLESAETEFRKAIDSNPHYITPYLNLATLKEKEDPQESIKILETAIQENPQEPEPYKKLSILYRKVSANEQKAEKYFRLYEKKLKN